MFKLSKKHTRAKERTRPHGAECAICAKSRRGQQAEIKSTKGDDMTDRSDASPTQPRCVQCGARHEELKPFGRDGELICYGCWMRDDSPSYCFSMDDEGRFRRLPDLKGEDA